MTATEISNNTTCASKVGELMDTIVRNRQNSQNSKEMGIGVSEDTTTREAVK